jgi:Tol biopolymer transport system component
MHQTQPEGFSFLSLPSQQPLTDDGFMSADEERFVMIYSRCLFILTALGLLSIGFYGFGKASRNPVQSKPPYASDEVMSEPRLFAEGVINTDDDTYGPAFTPDGKTVYFVKRIKEGAIEYIFLSRFVNGKWSEPQVAEFSGKYLDKEPFVSPDGSQLFFASLRPVEGTTPNKDFDIWMMRRIKDGWGPPEHLPAPVNTEAYENYPSVAANGTLYFGSSREGGKGRVDLYRAKLVGGKYTTVETLGNAINTAYTEADPYIAPDESFLIFTSSRPGGYGTGDLYLSFNKNGGWTPPKNLGPKVNSELFEYTALVTPDGKYLFFTRGIGKIYQIKLSALEIKP